MFESISYHIDIDTSHQAETETSFATKMLQRRAKNVKAITQHISSLSANTKHTPQRYALTVNTSKTLNICLKAAGVVLYGQNPENEAIKKVVQFLASSPLPQSNLVLVIIGIGLGYHLLPLIEQSLPRFVIIYEPELDIFTLSLDSAPWFALLTFCQAQGIQLFVQLGTSAKSVKADLDELKQAYSDAGPVYYFEHLHYPHLASELYQQEHSDNSKYCALTPQFLASAISQVNPRTISLSLSHNEQECFRKNLAWLAKNQSSLYQKLHSYQWQNWQLVIWQQHYAMQDKCGKVFSVSANKAHRGTIKQSSLTQDPVVFDFSLPEKLLNTAFATLFKNVKQLQLTIQTASEQNAHFVTERILLGSADYEACGKALENSEYLLVLEPDTDFLYASLFTVAWYQFKGDLYFCQQTAEVEQRITAQYQSGQLQLTDIFIDQPYYEKTLFSAYHLLLEIVQSCNGKSHYFEKQFASLNHYYQNISNATYLTNKQVSEQAPIFIVGNGPSLDLHIDYVVKHRKNLILISCGTALITLHRNGLTPDYHMELERGADTLFYLNKLPASYLKHLTLIGPADIHPAILAVFQKNLLVSVENTDVHQEFTSNFTHFSLLQLNYSYYTVTNFAVDLFLSIGVQKLYLIGVDFGFKNQNSHHARDSVYFQQDGSQLYDYEQTHGSAYVINANFGGECLTISSFDMARKLMGERIALSPAQQVFNCNDGAAITSSIPLRIPNITCTLSTTNAFKQDFLTLFVEANLTIKFEELTQQFKEKGQYCVKQLLSCLDENINAAPIYIASLQRQILNSTIASKLDHSYTLFDGSLRYFEMVSSRFYRCQAETQTNLALCQFWRTYLQHCLFRLSL